MYNEPRLRYINSTSTSNYFSRIETIRNDGTLGKLPLSPPLADYTWGRASPSPRPAHRPRPHRSPPLPPAPPGTQSRSCAAPGYPRWPRSATARSAPRSTAPPRGSKIAFSSSATNPTSPPRRNTAEIIRVSATTQAKCSMFADEMNTSNGRRCPASSMSLIVMYSACSLSTQRSL